MTPSRLVWLVIALALAVVGSPVDALAADAPSLTLTRGARFPHRSFVLTLPSSHALDPSAVHVTENGQPVRNLRVTPGDRSARQTFGVVLVIDASDSMRGKPIADAMAAARSFAAQRPANEQLGVVFFSSEPRVALAPTADPAKIRQALAAPPVLSVGTRIFDATSAGLQLLAASHVRVGSMVILSDGADTGSMVRQTAVSDAAARTHVRIFTIGLRSRSFDANVLSQVASAAGGSYAEAARSADLEPIFSALSRRLGNGYVLQYDSLAPVASRVEVVATVDGVAGAARISYEAPAIALPQTRAHVTSAGFWASWVTAGAVAAVVAVVLGLMVFVVVRRRVPTLRERIAGFVPEERSLDEQLAELVGSDAQGSEHSRLSRTAAWKTFVEDVDVAQLDIAPQRLVLVLVAPTLAFMLLGIAVGNVALVCLGLLVAAGGWWFVRFKAGRQRKAFEESLPDNLQVIASAMRAGHAFIGAMAVAAEDAGEPTGAEFRRVVSDEQLGMPLEQAVSRVAQRMRSTDFEYVGLVAALQRETGGNTAEVIDRVIDTIRERAALRRMVSTLTAQGRMSGGIVSILPIALAAVLSALHPGYFTPLLDSSFGTTLLVVAGVLVLLGWLVIRRIVDIKV